MFNEIEKVPKKLLSRVENLDCDFKFKNSIKDLLKCIAQNNTYNASFLENFDLYFGDTYNTENLIFHFQLNDENICIYDENNVGERCELFFEFVNNAQELEYSTDEKGKIFTIIRDCGQLQVIIKALEKMKSDSNLLVQYNVKKLITRRERINSNINKILSRKISS